jgi:hypothetical protein
MARTLFYYLQNEQGHYFTGEVYGKELISTSEKERASEMTEVDINKQFPKGIPSGWKKVEVTY